MSGKHGAAFVNETKPREAIIIGGGMSVMVCELSCNGQGRKKLITLITLIRQKEARDGK